MPWNETNRTVATLADLHGVTPWLWVICDRSSKNVSNP